MHTNEEKLYLPVTVYLEIITHLYLQMHAESHFCSVCALNYFCVIVCTLHTILQCGLDGFLQNSVLQAA